MAVPAPHPAPTVSPGYRSLLSAWLESHKRYPESARARGEEGRAVLRFRVDRSGRVLNYALAAGTGFADITRTARTIARGFLCLIDRCDERPGHVAGRVASRPGPPAGIVGTSRCCHSD